MKNMTVKNIAMACGGELVGADAVLDKEIKGAVIDSRLVEQDFLFFAIIGEKADGHDYIRAVHEKGALVSVCEHVPEGSEGACIVFWWRISIIIGIGNLCLWLRSYNSIRHFYSVLEV